MLQTFTFTFQGCNYQFNPLHPLDISLPLLPGTNTVNCFWAEPALIETIRVGDFVGSVAEGGACNYQRLHITPHGNGTHTECYGHISSAPEATIQNCLQQFLFFARVISLKCQPRSNGDEMIQLADVEAALKTQPLPEALIIRTLPNTEEKRTRQYSGNNPPYLEPGIGELLARLGIQHLLLDLPSVDREADEGVLANHHQFWQYPGNTREHCTITELIFVPQSMPDGLYLLNLQVTNLAMDASPSKPVLYALSTD